MTHTAVIVDYGAGNVRSVANALRAAVPDGESVEVRLSHDPDEVARADRIVLPGVGAFGACRAGLDATPGLIEALSETVRAKGRPFLGVCVGMQLMADEGLERGRHPGFSWVPGVVEPLQVDDATLKIPHMGWSPLAFHADHPVFAGMGAAPWVYFVHSFVLNPAHQTHIAADAHYGRTFAAAVARDTAVGVQFHPEKSQAAGLALLSAFWRWRP